MVNWALAIEHNRDALLRIVAGLFALVGIDGDMSVATLPRHLHNHVRRILRPAESAARRLIVIAARGLAVSLRPSREGAKPAGIVHPPGRRPEAEMRPAEKADPAFPVLDPQMRFPPRPFRPRPKSFPRICVIGVTELRPIPDGWFPSPGDQLDARGLCRRLHALKRALDDLDGHAKRLARWQARRDAAPHRFRRFSPMRPGRPPGHRKRPVHEVGDVLRECHSLALYARRLDTS